MESGLEAVAEEGAVDGGGGEEAVRGVDLDGDREGYRERPPRQVGVGTGNADGSKVTQFRPKHPGRPGPRRPKPAAKAAKPSQLLKDMRFVYGHDEEDDWSYGHLRCREWLNDDPRGFLLKLADLEKALAAQRR